MRRAEPVADALPSKEGTLSRDPVCSALVLGVGEGTAVRESGCDACTRAVRVSVAPVVLLGVGERVTTPLGVDTCCERLGVIDSRGVQDAVAAADVDGLDADIAKRDAVETGDALA